MTREEYEERKRRLDEQLRSGVELLEIAHRQQVRALDLVWSTTAEGDVALPRLTMEIPPQVRPPAAVPAPPGPPPRPARRAAWELYRDVKAALAHVPEIFDRNHMCQALGYEPDRGSLYRALQELKGEGVLAVHQDGSGRVPMQYRKIVMDVPRAGT